MSIINKILQERKMKGKDPCWKGYEMVGTKDKDGKQVPNCVPEETIKEEEKEIESSDYKTDKRGRKYRAHKIVFNTGEKMENSEPVKEEVELEENYGLHKKYYSMTHDELKNAHSKLVGQQTDLIRKAPNSTEREVIDQKIETVRGLLKAHQQKARKLKEEAELEELAESSDMDNKFAKAKGDDQPFATSKIGGTTVRHYKSDDGYIGHAWETKNGQTQYHEHKYEGEAHAKKEAKKHVEFHNEPAQLKSQLKSKAYGLLRKDRKMSEHVELDEAMKPYVSGDHRDGWTILNSKGKEVKTFHHTDYVDHPIADRRSAAKNDAMAYLKKHFNKLSEGVETIEEGNFVHYVQKADAAKSKGDEQEAKHHLKYAERLYNTMSNDEKSKVAKHVNLYKQMSESFEQMQESTIKVGDSIVWNKGKTGQTVGKVHKIEGDSYILHHARTNTYHKVPKLGSEVVKEEKMTDSEMKERERLVKGMKKSYKDFVSQYGKDKAKDVMYATATKMAMAKEEFEEDLYEEVEELDELSKATLASYIKKASRSVGAKRHLAGRFDTSALHKRTTATKAADERMADDFSKEARRRVKGIDKASDRLAKEEVDLEEAKEITHSGVKQLMGDTKTRDHAVEKVMKAYKCDRKVAEKHVDHVIDSSMKEDFENSMDVFVIGEQISEAQSRYSDSYKFTYVPGNAEHEKQLADLKASVKGTGNRVVLQGRLGKDNPNAHKYSTNAPNAKYDSKGKRTNSDVSGKSGAHSHQRIQKADAAHHDVYVYSKGINVREEHIVESFDLMEGMIERDDFDDMLAARKKTSKVIDYKHTDNKAHITYVDGEGVKRTVKYTPTGKSMINHGPYEGGEQIADTKGKVNKTEVKTVKRGRGRPRKDKFAEAAEILVGLSEEDFSNLMENYSLDQLVDALMSDLEDSQ